MSVFLVETAAPIAGILYGFQAAGIAGKAIAVLLFAGSIAAWTLMYFKWREQQGCLDADQAFIDAYRKEPTPVGLFLKHQHYRGGALYAIYEAICKGLGAEYASRGTVAEDLFQGNLGESKFKLGRFSIGAVRKAADYTMADQLRRLDDRMRFLINAVSTAPLLGFLGTIWSVMDVLGGATVSNGATVATLAPVLAGALIPAAVGLLVAVPSTVGYTLLSSRQRRIATEMNHFVQELLLDVERHYLDTQ